MALQPVSARQLEHAPTLFASFMGERDGDCDGGYKTVGELLAIYRERSRAMCAAEDHADDLRVTRFMDDMAHDRWQDDVVMRIGVFGDRALVIDGIHRAIAYLGCIEDGISPERLPPLHIHL